MSEDELPPLSDDADELKRVIDFYSRRLTATNQMLSETKRENIMLKNQLDELFMLRQMMANIREVMDHKGKEAQYNIHDVLTCGDIDD